jgi:hypothetical protein
VASNVVGTMCWPEYSSLSRTVSELYAIGAPSRPWIFPLGLAYDVLLVAFAIGVARSAGGRRGLRVTAATLFAVGVIGPFWPPMHLRGTTSSLTDTLHVVVAGVVAVLNLLGLGFGADALGKRFRRYTIATLLVVLAFGVLTGADGPRVAANLPTPWIGLYERINIGGWLLWIAVLSVALLRAEAAANRSQATARTRKAPVDADARYALELVERVCKRVGPGLPGSPQERARAAVFANEMRSHLGAANVLIEEFTLAPGACLGVFPIGASLILCAALANVASARLAGTASWAAAVAALALSVMAPTLWLLEFVFELEVVDRFFPKRQSVNVIGRICRPGAKAPKRLVILSGHHDSAPENTWFGLLGYAALVASVIPFAAFIVMPAMSVLQLAGLATGSAAAFHTGTLGWGMLASLVLPAVVYGAFFNRGWRKGGTVPGAADNLSGSAIVVVMSRFFAENPSAIPEDTEVRFVTFGGEEAGLRGSRRYVERHLDELKRLRVRLLNFETIAHPKMTVLSSDVHGTVKSSSELVEGLAAAAERAGVPHEVKRAFLGVATDAGPFCRAGLDAATVMAFEIPRQLVAFYHQKSDRPEVLDGEALSNGLKIARAWIEGEGR